MRRTLGLATLASLCLSAASPAFAEEEAPPVFGLGVGVNLGNLFSGGAFASSPVGLYLPINIGKAFRLEPSVSFWYTDKGITISAVNGLLSRSGHEVEAALGAFYLLHPGTPKFTVYLGVRFGAAWVGHDFADNNGTITSVNQNNFFFTPTVGLEWSVSRNFSVGGEAGPAFRFYSDPSSTVGTGLPSSKFGTGLQATIFLRLYF
ncbi:MAG: outer membrane beta-barrel protein [Myxococcaceae bacterium]